LGDLRRQVRPEGFPMEYVQTCETRGIPLVICTGIWDERDSLGNIHSQVTQERFPWNMYRQVRQEGFPWEYTQTGET
jgi:hypothetical protein